MGEGEIIAGRLGMLLCVCDLGRGAGEESYLRFGFFCRCETKQQCGDPLELWRLSLNAGILFIAYIQMQNVGDKKKSCVLTEPKYLRDFIFAKQGTRYRANQLTMCIWFGNMIK